MTIQDRITLLGPGQKQTVNFYGTVAPFSAQVLVSPIFARPFHIYLVRPHFALNQNRTLQLSFYAALDNSESSALPLSGTNLLQQSSLTTYAVGDDESKDIFLDFWQFEGNGFIKVYANNTDGHLHTIDCQIFIEIF